MFIHCFLKYSTMSENNIPRPSMISCETPDVLIRVVWIIETKDTF